MKPIAPAHPFLADAICALGRAFCNAFEPAWLHVWAHRVFWAAFALSTIAIDAAAYMGLLP